LGRDGYYHPIEDLECPLCENARWISSYGSHMRSNEHIVAKFRVSRRRLQKAQEYLTILSHGQGLTPDVAYKRLSFGEGDLSGLLVSPHKSDEPWQPGKVYEATCVSSDMTQAAHTPPGEDCTCGIYAFWDPVQAFEYPGGDVTVRLKIGGLIEDCEEGCRAQYAVITGLVYLEHARDSLVVDTASIELSARYGVPAIPAVRENQGEKLRTMLEPLFSQWDMEDKSHE
jgi:hypothetical protein